MESTWHLSISSGNDFASIKYQVITWANGG